MASPALVPRPDHKHNKFSGREPAKMHTLYPAGVLSVVANKTCASCHGIGSLDFKFDAVRVRTPCQCALLNVFRICAERYLQSEDSTRLRPREFRADFELVIRRAIGNDGWRRIADEYLIPHPPRRRRPGGWYRQLDHLRQKAGRAFLSNYPYPLFPIDAYMTSNLDAREASARVYKPKKSAKIL